MESGLFDSISLVGASGDQFRPGMRVERNFFYQGYVAVGGHGGYPDADGPTGRIVDNILQRFKGTGTDDNRGQPGWGLRLGSGAYQVEVARNIVTNAQHEWGSYGLMIFALGWNNYNQTFHYPTRENAIFGNIFDSGSASSAVLVSDGVDSNLLEGSGWVYPGVTQNSIFDNILINENSQEWLNKPKYSAVGTTNDTLFEGNHVYASRAVAAEALNWKDPNRTLKTYLLSLGVEVKSEDGYMEFFNEAKLQRKGYWRKAYTSKPLLNHIRGGFSMPLLSVDNKAPVAKAQSVNEDVSLNVMLVGTDADGDILTYSNTQPSEGALSGTAPNLVYTPNADFNGSDSFTFTVNDGQGGSDTATVSITIHAVNNAPTATASGLPTSGTAPFAVNFTGSASDIDSSSFTYSWSFGDGSSSTAQNPSHTYSTVNTFTATLTVSDGSLSDTDTVSISASAPAPVNTAPVAESQSVSMNEDASLSISLSGTDADGDSLTYSNTQPSEGALSGTAPNLVYTPNANFNGSDSFTLTVNDGQSASNTATVSITVNAVNDAPTATASATPTSGIIPLVVSFTGSASDIDSSSLTYSWTFGDGSSSTVQNPSHTFTSEGSFTATLTVSDGSLSGTDTVNIDGLSASSHIPGDVTLKAIDQNGDAVLGAQIEVRTRSSYVGDTYAAGTKVSLTVGSKYYFIAKNLGVSGGSVYVAISDSMTELVLDFQTVTLKAQDQNSVDVLGASVALRANSNNNELVGSPFSVGSKVSLPTNSTVYALGSVLGATGPSVKNSISSSTLELDPGFWTTTLVARNQDGLDVAEAKLVLRASSSKGDLVGSPFAHGSVVTVPKGDSLFLAVDLNTVIGSRTATLFTDGLSEAVGHVYDVSVVVRDPLGQAVADGKVVVRRNSSNNAITGSPFVHGDVVRVPTGSSLYVASQVGVFVANRFKLTFASGLSDIGTSLFQSALFKVIAIDGSTLVTGAEIEIYNSGLARLNNDTRRGLAIPAQYRFRVRYDGGLIADLRNVLVNSSTDTITIATAWDANDVDGDGIPNAQDGDYLSSKALSKAGDPLWVDKSKDFNNDGIPDATDPDVDGDGILNADDGQFITLEDGTEEWADMSRDFDNDGINNCADADDDNDGASDVLEFEKGTNSQSPDVAVDVPDTDPVVVPENDPIDRASPITRSQRRTCYGQQGQVEKTP